MNIEDDSINSDKEYWYHIITTTIINAEVFFFIVIVGSISAITSTEEVFRSFRSRLKPTDEKRMEILGI